MKARVFISEVVGGVVALIASAGFAAEALQNGGFEEADGALASGWNRFIGGYSMDGAVRHSGTRSLKCVSVAGGKGAGARQELLYATPDRTPVVFGGWVRSKDTVAHPQFYLDIEYADGTWEWAVNVSWRTGTHDWRRGIKVFEPKKPIRHISAFLLLRDGEGTAWFDDMFLARRNPGFELMEIERTTERPFRDVDYARIVFGRDLSWQVNGASQVSGKGKEALVPISTSTGEIAIRLDDGKTNVVSKVAVPPSTLRPNTLQLDEVTVWTADSMRMVTPLTFPDANERSRAPSISLELAGRERESAQVMISTGDAKELEVVEVRLLPLVSVGAPLKGGVTWNRIGYLARDPGYSPHALGANPEERWLPDPLLPPKPFKVRKGATQGIWLTVQAAADAKPGRYVGAVMLLSAGKVLAKVPVSVRVRAFALPERFGMGTSFSVMDGFTRAMYPDRFAEMRRQSHDLLLDSRINPDDISRTTPPSVEDVAYWRSRGMSTYNLLNYVPPPSDPKQKWVCTTSKDEAFKPALYEYVKGKLASLVAELRRRGLLEGAYIYGFDERGKEFYKGIENLWHQWRKDFPDVPMMTTAFMFKDLADGAKETDELYATDWHCPLTPVYKEALADKYRAKGRKVWWYVCCGPKCPYANFASLEYPWADGRLLGWMTWRYRADGLLYWHVNYWTRKGLLKDYDTFFPGWKTGNSLRMPGDGIMLYPGEKEIWPSVRLAEVRDGEEDWEWLRLAAKAAGEDKVMESAGTLIHTMRKYERSPDKIRAARTRLAGLIEGNSRSGR